MDVAEAMHWFSDRWAFWGHWNTVFALARASAHAIGDADLEATHVNYLSWTYTFCRCQPDIGLSLAKEAEALARQAGGTVQEAWALVLQTFAAAELAEHTDAIPQAQRAAELFAAAGDKEGYAQAQLALARHLGGLKRLEEAVDTLNIVVDLVNDPRTAPVGHIADCTAMRALNSKALLLLELGDWEVAKQTAEQALALDSRVGIPALRGSAALSKARALKELGEEGEAVLFARDAVRSYSGANDISRGKAAQQLLDQWSDKADQV